MPIFSNIGPLLRAPVGNNLENRLKDVRSVKRHYTEAGLYKAPVENGYIDQELHDVITGFQKNNNLKIDGIMNPGGETEATLIGKRLGLPEPEWPKNKNIHEASAGVMARVAIPALIGAIALGLNMKRHEDADEWWKDRSTDEREDVVRSLDYTLNNRNDGDDCDKEHEKSLKRCAEVERKLGYYMARICRETAFTRYSQCRANNPVNPDDRRRIHTWE